MKHYGTLRDSFPKNKIDPHRDKKKKRVDILIIMGHHHAVLGRFSLRNELEEFKSIDIENES